MSGYGLSVGTRLALNQVKEHKQKTIIEEKQVEVAFTAYGFMHEIEATVMVQNIPFSCLRGILGFQDRFPYDSHWSVV